MARQKLTGIMLFCVKAVYFVCLTCTLGVSPGFAKVSAIESLRKATADLKDAKDLPPTFPIADVPANAEVVVLTIPKTGTHLFIKSLGLITQKNVFGAHFRYKSNRDYLYAHPEIPVIIPMRDLRDAFISGLHAPPQTDNSSKTSQEANKASNKNQGAEKPSNKSQADKPSLISHTISSVDDGINIVVDDKFVTKWSNANFDEKLSMFLDPEEPLPISLMVDYELCEEFIAKRPNVLVVKFEDMVGSAGGGNDDLQKEEIKKIIEFLNISSANRLKEEVEKIIGFPNFQYALSDIEQITSFFRSYSILNLITPLLKYRYIQSTPANIDRVAENVFGNSATFRKGKIGGWKHHFKPQHVALAKRYLQDFLVKYGYEKDEHWDNYNEGSQAPINNEKRNR